MSRDRRMTFKAREPPAAALELYRDYVQLAVIMRASGLFIDLDAVDILTMDQTHTIRF